MSVTVGRVRAGHRPQGSRGAVQSGAPIWCRLWDVDARPVHLVGQVEDGPDWCRLLAIAADVVLSDQFPQFIDAEPGLSAVNHAMTVRAEQCEVLELGHSRT